MRLNYSERGTTGIIYDGVNLSEIFQIVEIKQSLLPSIELNTLDLAQHDGTHFMSRSVKSREIKITVRLDADEIDPTRVFSEFRKMTSVFDKSEPKKLYMNDELYTYAILTGETDLTTESFYGEVEFTFICPVPYFYGKTHEIPLGYKTDFLVFGDIATWPKISVTPSYNSNVKITNAKTGDYVLFNGKQGVTYTIDMEAQSVFASNGYVPVTLDSTFFNIKDSASITVSGGTLNASLTYTEVYI